MVVLAVLSATLIAISPAATPAPATANVPAAAGDEGDKSNAAERRICKRLDGAGSRMQTQRVCMTRREWREHDRNNR